MRTRAAPGAHPGPWIADTEPRPILNPRAGQLFIRDASGAAIAGAFSGSGRCKANARLIASAPALRAALEGLVSAHDFNSASEMAECWDQARSALAAAGESSPPAPAGKEKP